MLFALSQYTGMKLSWDQQLIKLIIHLLHVGYGFQLATILWDIHNFCHCNGKWSEIPYIQAFFTLRSHSSRCQPALLIKLYFSTQSPLPPTLDLYTLYLLTRPLQPVKLLRSSLQPFQSLDSPPAPPNPLLMALLPLSPNLPAPPLCPPPKPPY